MAMDAFTLNWVELQVYANPPWNLSLDPGETIR